ncbi:MAG: helix-turn-helix transcriptional regulator [Lachnospiraceae bacterium]|nr:helix-turn-helix transcriptional regulator [Lachnospiraceae bacterium]
MLKIFWDKDNIAFIGNQVNAAEHSHCVLQVLLSIDEPLQVTVDNECISGKCIIINKNVRHIFLCDNNVQLSILIEPSSNFAKELIKKIHGNYLKCDSEIESIQKSAAILIDTNNKQHYINFIQDFAKYLGVKRGSRVLDKRITDLLEILQNCNCYDHSIENLAKSVCLSSSRLSHLFREQVGVPLKSYILFHQLEKAFTALLNGSNITNAAMLAGFDSPSHFAATVRKWTGMPVSASIRDSEFLKVFI